MRFTYVTDENFNLVNARIDEFQNLTTFRIWWFNTVLINCMHTFIRIKNPSLVEVSNLLYKLLKSLELDKNWVTWWVSFQLWRNLIPYSFGLSLSYLPGLSCNIWFAIGWILYVLLNNNYLIIFIKL